MTENHLYHITLLRHGESEGNRQRLFQGQLDFPLTKKGRKQARTLGEYWRTAGQEFDEIIASPLARAAETAQFVADALGMPITFEDAWKEWDFGALSSQNYIDYHENPDNKKYLTPYDQMGETGESGFEAFGRAGLAMHNLMRRPPGRYLIVSHGALLNKFMYHVFGIATHPDDEGPRVRFWNTSFASLVYRPENHRWTLMGANQQPHLKQTPTMRMVSDRHEPVYDLTLVRHGESEGNLKGYWQGQAEFPLTELGRQQAQALADYWVEQKIYFDYAFASPQSRAYQTAKTLTDTLGMSLESNSLWMERDNGHHAGTNAKNRIVSEPDHITPYERVGEIGETGWELFARGGKALQSILHRKPGRYLIVSHGGILNMAVYAALGIPPIANHRGPRFGFGNTSVAHMIYRPSLNQWHIFTMNDTTHLKELAPAEPWRP